MRLGVGRTAIKVGAVATVLTLSLGVAGGLATVAHAVGSSYLASDNLGQVTVGGSPVWTTNSPNNGGGVVPSAQSLAYPQGSAVDPVGHRLFEADCGNNRVVVYPLDANNNLTSHTAIHVLGQATFVTHVAAAGAAGLQCPVGPTYDPVHQRLFVVDDNNNRVVVYDLSAGISDGMNATWVLGQSTFAGTGTALTQSGMNQPYGGSELDPTTNYFYVSDGQNARVLVFDLSAGITNGMNAAFVLGQPDFTTNSTATTASKLNYAYGLALDVRGRRLFVADTSNTAHRVMVFNIAGGLSNGMAAANVLGQPDFTTATHNADNKAATDDPEDLAYDPVNQHLFVQDDRKNRTLMFDVSTIANGQEAVAVLGQPDFATTSGLGYANNPCVGTTQGSQCDAEGQSEYYDAFNNRLYLSDSSDNRVLVFNFVRISNGALGAATTGSPYSQSLTPVNAQGTVSYALTSGQLPAGLSLNTATGVISGTPTASGTSAFSVTATDDNGAIGVFSSVKALSITVGSAPASVPVPDTGSATGQFASGRAPLGALAVLLGIASVGYAVVARRRMRRRA